MTMMYGLSIHSDGAIELFDIKNSMVDFIVEDSQSANSNSIISKARYEISINRKNLSTTYFYNKEDRRDEVLRLL